MTRSLGYYSRFKAISDIWEKLAKCGHFEQQQLHKEKDEMIEVIKQTIEKYKDHTFDIYRDRGFYYASFCNEFADIKKLKYTCCHIEKALQYVYPEQISCLFE